MKVSRKTFLYLDLRFVLFWRKNIGAKAVRIMLVKLTLGEEMEDIMELVRMLLGIFISITEAKQWQCKPLPDSTHR